MLGGVRESSSVHEIQRINVCIYICFTLNTRVVCKFTYISIFTDNCEQNFVGCTQEVLSAVLIHK